MTPHFFAAAASLALLGAGFSAVDGTRSANALPMRAVSLTDGEAGAGGRSRVDVIRTGPSGTAKITRHTLTDGTTVCTVTTGPAENNGDAENIVNNLLRDRACEGAPAPGRPVSDVAIGASGPAGSLILPILIGTVGVAGLGAALGGDSKG